MNSLTIPPSPNWYEVSILACSPDNTLIYGSKTDLVVIENSKPQEANYVRIISRAHSQKILSVDLNRNWGQPNKFAVTVSEDKIVKIWNIETMKKHSSHNEHLKHGKVIGATFAGQDKVISVSEDGVIVLWNFSQNQTTVLNDLFTSRVTVTCISTCPHATWLTAFGLKNGLVVVADLRKKGKVLYKLRGHEKSVLSLSWCPVPINIFPKNPLNHVRHKEAVKSKEISENNILITEADAKELDSECLQSAKINGNSIVESERDQKTDACSLDDPQQNGLHHLLKVYESGDEEFLKECQNLRNKITGNMSDRSNNESPALLKPDSNVLEAEIKLEADNASVCVAEKDLDGKNSSGESVEGVSTKTEISLIFSSRDVSTDVEITDEATDDLFGKDLKEDEGIQRNNSVVKEESENVERDQNVDDVSKEIYVVNKEETAEKVIVAKNEDASTCSEEQKPEALDSGVICSTPKKHGDISRTDDSERISGCDIIEKNNPDMVTLASEKSEHTPDIETENLDDGGKTDGKKICGEVGKDISNEAEYIEFLVASAREGTPKHQADVSGIDNSETLSGFEITDENSLATVTPVEEKTVQNLAVQKENSDDVEETDEKKTCDEVGRTIVTKTTHVDEEELPRKDFLLASSAREGNIYIWRAGTDGRMQTFFSIPNKSNNRKSKLPVDKTWITLCWVSPTVLLSSSKSSELLQWTLPKPKDKSKSMSLVHNDHSTMLFSIASPPVIYNESNWMEKRNLSVWTVGQDRLLLNTSLSNEKTNLACYPTLGGTVSCLELSPLDPNRLAVGTGDGFIKIWDLSRPHTKQIIMTSFYQKIQSKVMALAWHPTNELLLAFGTLEGRLGCLDTNNKSKSPVILPHFFKTHIYKMEWAPMHGKKEFGLYVVAEGSVVLFDTSKSGKDPVEIDKPDNTFIYSFSWKRDYSLMMASTKSGFIIVYSPDLKILCKHYFQERLQEIFWHPNSIESTSKQSNWFACTTNSKKLILYDFDVESKDNGTKIVAKYEGLGDLITSVSWSPYDGNQLVIASENGVAQVWDVEKDEIISTFMSANCDGIMRAIFSPVDQDYVICGGRDSSVKIWKISDNPPKDANDILATRKDILKEISAESADLLPKSEGVREETAKIRKLSKNVLLPNFYPKRESSKIVADLKKLMLWKENPERVEASVGDCTEPDILDIFGKNEDMIKLITLNETVNKQKGKYNMNTMLTMFRGDIHTSIKETIEERRVTPWIISLAPMVSPKLWLSACETYANQLSEEQDADPLEIATYFLACHKLEEAINCLCKASMFREALALAKSRLTENDETITKIIEEWAKYSMQVGNFETAAQCNVFLGKYEEAASALFRRSDIEIIEFAAELAEKSGNEELHKAVLFRYDSFKEMCDNNKTEEALPTKAEAFLQKSEEMQTAAETSESSQEKMNVSPNSSQEKTNGSPDSSQEKVNGSPNSSQEKMNGSSDSSKEKINGSPDSSQEKMNGSPNSSQEKMNGSTDSSQKINSSSDSSQDKMNVSTDSSQERMNGSPNSSQEMNGGTKECWTDIESLKDVLE